MYSEYGVFMRRLDITDKTNGQRLDKLLMKYLNEAPKSFIYKMLRKKNIKLNGAKASGNEMLQSGDYIEIYLSEETIEKFTSTAVIEKAGELDVIYEDKDILIVNKPVGIAVQKDVNHKSDTLNDRILYYLYRKGVYKPDNESVFTPSICNRLDFNTAGIVTAGKSAEGLRELNRIFRERLVDKYYMAMVVGKVERGGTVEGYQTKLDGNISVVANEAKDKSVYVCTHYKPIAFGNGYTLLEVKLDTGKSHQIRVALSSIHHPIVGDTKYGDAGINKIFREKYGLDGQFLCCKKLKFNTDGVFEYMNKVSVEANLPHKMYKIFEDYFKN